MSSNVLNPDRTDGSDLPEDVIETAAAPTQTGGPVRDIVIQTTGLSKSYIASKKPGRRMWELLLGLKPRLSAQIECLSDVSFELERGDRLGIMGENGAGKSTLLKMLCGVLQPSEGSVFVDGRISALLELGAGFNPDLTGLENIWQFCRLHGMSAADTEAAIPAILSFSELGDTINMPIRAYSSGEGLRLGFSCAVHVRPDILIVDEALSVGDAYFQVKCLNKIQAMLNDGVTFLYVTHSPDAVRSLCNKGLWLEDGQIRMWGSSKEVSEAYQATMFKKVSAAGFKDIDTSVYDAETKPALAISDNDKTTSIPPKRAAVFAERVQDLRSGSGEFKVLDVMIVDENSEPTNRVDYENNFNIKIFYEYRGAVDTPVDIGVGISDARGIQIMHHSTLPLDIDARSIGQGKKGVLNLKSRNLLCPGSYSINVGVNTLFHHPTMSGKLLVDKIFDFCAGAETFIVCDPQDRGDNIWGLVKADYQASLSPLSE